jgi:hypothetical protein
MGPYLTNAHPIKGVVVATPVMTMVAKIVLIVMFTTIAMVDPMVKHYVAEDHVEIRMKILAWRVKITIGNQNVHQKIIRN